MAEPIVPEWQNLQKRAFNMSCEDQIQLAKVIAANVGYEIVPDMSKYDEMTIEDRVTRLEEVVRELNPGAQL